MDFCEIKFVETMSVVCWSDDCAVEDRGSAVSAVSGDLSAIQHC